MGGVAAMRSYGGAASPAAPAVATVAMAAFHQRGDGLPHAGSS